MPVRKQPVRRRVLPYAGIMQFLGLDIRALDRARLSRDSRFDGKFFIAVTSTRVYCRPICPVRSPKKSHIRYYPTAAAAAEAGFRPCLRCRPEAAPGTPAWLGTVGAVRRGLRLIEDGYLDQHSVEQLAQLLGIGTRHLHRLFIQHVGASPVVVAQTRRLHFAKRLLDDTSLPITSIALSSGFGSVRRFNDVFRETYKRSPRESRKRRSVCSDASDEVALKLSYRPPYDWAYVCEFLAARAIPEIEKVEAGRYARVVSTPHGPAVIQVRQIACEDALELRVSGANKAALLQLSTTARRVFDLAADPFSMLSAFKRNSRLQPLISRRPGLRIPGVWDPFECAVRAIVGQQVSLAAGVTFLRRLAERAANRIATPVPGLSLLFPTPDQLRSADLSGLGLTNSRIATIKELADAVCDQRIDFAGASDDVVHALTDVRGIGPWTAQYVALRALGEPDAFPSADLVLRRMASNGHETLSPAALERMSHDWRPWRSYAAIHLWCEATRRSCLPGSSERPPPRGILAGSSGDTNPT
jgi:AraC family transcriptional regulator of adaptative response / DNA-3-methyladenine glycosylase II